MALLGKDPLWYGLRSIRQGASTMADRLNMPEVFLRASGSWKGNALELYRKDRLPEEQERFADALGSHLPRNSSAISQQTPSLIPSLLPGHDHQLSTISAKPPHQFDPANLCGSRGIGGGQNWEDCSPPPSKLARNGRRRSRPPPTPNRESHYLRSDRPFALRRSNQEAAIRFKEKGSPRVGGARLGETVLNNVGERGGLLRDNARCPIIQSIDIRSCGNLDPITEPQYSISAGYLAES